eukprot:gb/GEZJ01001940.1/.p1 GENE.gb/GEZJ01001940.1/~~gb/GEZJ01001940.1/.p1  ORF type:complete len:214 (-),score=17.13 gb/GEZJ01001940.1/:1976-2617(-)
MVVFLFSTVLLSVYVALLFIICDGASTRTRTTSRCTIDSRGVHKCPKDAPEESNGLEPRAETYFTQKIPVTTEEMNFEFTANYFVSSVKRTTIAQLLNEDLTNSDKYKPVLFIVAWKKSNGNLKLCMFESCKHTWDDVTAGFRMSIKASGKRAQVVVAGRAQKTFDLVRPLNGAYRPRGAQQMRWGTYHHDISNKKAASEARVRVYNIDSRGF